MEQDWFATGRLRINLPLMSPNEMNSEPTPLLNRRQAISATGLLAGGAALAAASGSVRADHHKKAKAFRFGLNMSTIRGHNLDAAEEIEVAGKVGYQCIEPWFRKIGDYVKSGGKLKDLKKRIDDQGLTVESAIGFAAWIVDDAEKRAKGFEDAKRDMDTIAQLGGKRIAAPPAGVSRKDPPVDPMRAAERYHELCELGDKMGVVPQIEMWGGHPCIGTVGKAVSIMIESGHPSACFLGDVYHTYKGGSHFGGLKHIPGRAIQTFHMNDYPADPPRETIRDEHRVYPGDGIAPMNDILRGFREVGAAPVLNLELFNKSYWKQPVMEVAKTGLRKMKEAVAKAGV